MVVYSILYSVLCNKCANLNEMFHSSNLPKSHQVGLVPLLLYNYISHNNSLDSKFHPWNGLTKGSPNRTDCYRRESPARPDPRKSTEGQQVHHHFCKANISDLEWTNVNPGAPWCQLENHFWRRAGHWSCLCFEEVKTCFRRGVGLDDL